MRSPATARLLALLLLGVAACHWPSRQLVVRVGTDLPLQSCGGRLTSFQLRVTYDPSSCANPFFDQRVDLRTDNVPFEFLVREQPGTVLQRTPGDPNRALHLCLTAQTGLPGSPGASILFTREVVTRFPASPAVVPVLELTLATACIGGSDACVGPNGLTCGDDGTCVSRVVDVATLPAWNPAMRRSLPGPLCLDGGLDAGDSSSLGDTRDASDAAPQDAPDAATMDSPPPLSEPAPEPAPDVVVTCVAPLLFCNGGCVDPRSDLAHCGGCNAPCSGGANASPVCAMGVCGLQCATGWDDCDGRATNGCESSLSSDSRHCGSCANACASGVSCVAGACADREVVSLAVGAAHACATRQNGEVLCWGANGSGQLGDGTTSDRTSPVLLTSAALPTVAGLALGGAHSCAIQPNVGSARGRVLCWGANDHGQLGNGTTSAPVTSPSPVMTLNDVSVVATGRAHSCALQANSIYCWGDGGQGQVGVVPPGNRSTPLLLASWGTINGLALGNNHSCAHPIGTTRNLRCWGSNQYGQLGVGLSFGSGGLLTPSLDMPLVGFNIFSGDDHACAVLEGSAGRLSCWGRNDHGQLGDGTTTTRYQPQEMPGTYFASGVSLGADHSCMITMGGQLFCWGGNDTGQLGDGTTTEHPTLAAVAGLTGTVLAVGAGSHYTCALVQPPAGHNAVRCWGRNDHGQLGNGSTTPSPSAVTVNIPP